MRRSLNLIEFLHSARQIVEDTYDPRYFNVTKNDIIEMDSLYGRDVSLADGLRNPELVAPRTKVCNSCFINKSEIF